MVKDTSHPEIEILKCAQNFKYFCKNLNIRHPIKGSIPFRLYPYQTNMFNHVNWNEKTIFNCSRQIGGTTLFAAYFLWKAQFNWNQSLTYFSYKRLVGEEFIRKIQFMYDTLPEYLKMGIDKKCWNRHALTFANKSRIMANNINENSLCGLSFNEMLIEHISFVDNYEAEAFMTSLYPMMEKTNIIMLDGAYRSESNIFQKMWNRALDDDDYQWKPMLVPWSIIPGRNNSFKDSTIEVLGSEQFNREYRCEF